MKIRLQIYLARAGLAPSRRKAEALIAEGKVKINGKIAKLGDKVDTAKDSVSVGEQKVVPVKRKIYLMLNKPLNTLVAKSDARGRPLSYDLLKQPSMNNEKLSEAEFNSLFNVGRLDFNTEGLLLFTNDGDFALKLTHPRYRIKKVYIAKVIGRISDESADKLRRGVWVTVKEFGKTKERYRSAPATVRVLGRSSEYSVIVIRIAEGRKREVRRMCSAVGNPVETLKRVQLGDLELKDLQIGKWRFLSAEEVSRLKGMIYKKEEKFKSGKRFPRSRRYKRD